MTTPLLFSWPYWPIFCVVWVWAFWREFKIVRAARKPAARSDSPDAGSYRVIVFGGGIAALLGFPLAWMPLLQLLLYTAIALRSKNAPYSESSANHIAIS